MEGGVLRTASVQPGLGDGVATVGLDFDNTIICYDALFHSAALAAGLIEPGVAQEKRAVRDALRARPEGEYRWQCLQAEVYGPRIGDAAPFPGLIEFLREGRSRGVRFCIVSHKSRYAAQDVERRHDLVEAARRWLSACGIVSPEGPVRPEDAFFEPTRAGKVSRIGRLGCRAFVDDLEETFAEPGFPEGTRPFLFADPAQVVTGASVTVCRSWEEISARLWEGWPC